MKLFGKILIFTLLQLCKSLNPQTGSESVSSSPSTTPISTIISTPASETYLDHLDENVTDDSVTAISRVLKLFCIDLIHNFDLILYGSKSNERNLARIQNYIGHHQKYSRMITSTVLADYEHNMSSSSSRNPKSRVHESFKNVLSSCLQSFHTEHKVIIFIQPESQKEAYEMLIEINSFYEKNYSKALTTYFFIWWSFRFESQNNNNSESHGQFKNSRSQILDIVQSAVRVAPVDIHLYILSSENENGGYYNQPWFGQSQTHSHLHGRSGAWTIWEFYYVFGQLFFEPVRCSAQEFEQIVRSRRDFKGATVRAIVQADPTVPQITIFNEVNGKLEFASSVSYSFFKPMSEIMNFKVNFVLGTGWIEQGSDGRLLRMGKQLLENEGDMIMSISEVVSYRLKHLAMSHPTLVFEFNAYFKQPPRGLYRDILYEAFSPELWVLVLTTWIIIVACLTLFSFVKKKYSKISCSESDKRIGEDAVYWAVSAACQGGWPYTPKSTSLKIVFLCGLVSGFVYYTAYSASIISIFSVEPEKFQTLADLEQHGFKLYANNISLTEHYYVEQQAKRDGEKLQSRLISVTEGIKKIKNFQTAYLISREILYFRAMQENNEYNEFCKDLSKLPRLIGRQYNVWFFRKFDPLRKFLNVLLTRFKEQGLIFRTRMDHARALPAPCDQQKRKTAPLAFQDVRTAFVILVVGYLCCACALAIEIIISSSRRGKSSNKKEENNRMGQASDESVGDCCCCCHKYTDKGRNYVGDNSTEN